MVTENLNCAKSCACQLGIPAGGVSCSPLMGIPKKLMFVNQYDSTGTANFIDLTATLNTTTFNAFLNQADLTKRWNPAPDLLDIEDVRDKTIFQTAKNGQLFYVRDGIRSFKGTLYNGLPYTKGWVSSLRCQNNIAVFIVDNNGGITGNISSDGSKLYPIVIDAGSIAGTFGKPTDTTVQNVLVEFNFDPSQDDACLRTLTLGEMDQTAGNFDPRNWTGLIPVFLNSIQAVHAGVFKFNLYTPFGPLETPTCVEGVVIGNLAVNNLGNTPFTTTPVVISLSGFVTAADLITYSVTLAAGSAANGIQLVVSGINGYDFSGVSSKITVLT